MYMSMDDDFLYKIKSPILWKEEEEKKGGRVKSMSRNVSEKVDGIL